MSSYSAEVYKKLYEDNIYGQANVNRCPGFRHIPKYKHWLKGHIWDLGAGTGDTMRGIKELDFEVTGFDWCEKNNEVIVKDITFPLFEISGGTAICMDVIEHIPDSHLWGLLENMQRADRQIFTIHTKTVKVKGVELHINLKTFEEWREILDKLFKVEEEIEVKEPVHLYLCQSL